MAEEWATALAIALTDSLALPADVGGDVAGVVAALGAERIAACAAERGRQGLPWPVPCPPPADIGAAQWVAMLRLAEILMAEANSLRAERVPREGAYDADDRRLLAEAPPHHLG